MSPYRGSADPVFDSLRHRDDRAVREAYMKRITKEAADRVAKIKANGGKGRATRD